MNMGVEGLNPAPPGVLVARRHARAHALTRAGVCVDAWGRARLGVSAGAVGLTRFWFSRIAS